MEPASPELEPPVGPLVSADWLQANLNNPRVRVLDVRGRHPSSSLPHAKRAEYAAGHIPGAVFVDWEHDFVDPDDPVPVQIAGAEAFAARAGRARCRRRRPRCHLRRLLRHLRRPRGVGVSLLRRRGAGARRRLEHLGGGGPAGQRRERHAAATGSPPARGRGCAARWPRSRPPRLRGATLVDARPRHLFIGEPGVANTGHIPGSRCLPYQELVDGATGLWAAPAAVSRLARTRGSTQTDRRGS